MIYTEHAAHLKRVTGRDRRYSKFASLAVVHRHTHKRKKYATIKFDHTNLAPGVEGLRFNPSIIASGDGYLYCWRTGWAGSHIYAIRLDSQFQPYGEAKLLPMAFKASRWGREDPRWFRLNGHLHIMFIGVVGKNGPTNVCFARIHEETLTVEDMFHPKVPGRQEWEKNHAYFDVGGIAHSVYTIAPHRIMRVEGRKAEFVYETPTRVQWTGGRICGGASPVLHNDQWYHFFHGSTEWNGRRQYNMGCYTFENKPPYRILRFTQEPIDVAGPASEHDHTCDVLFPGGAVLVNGQWCIAQGIHDRWSELRFYDYDMVEEMLGDIQ